jgi:hypothetical protein
LVSYENCSYRISERAAAAASAAASSNRVGELFDVADKIFRLERANSIERRNPTEINPVTVQVSAGKCSAAALTPERPSDGAVFVARKQYR